MSTATGKVQCFICNKEKNTYKCGGCSKDFCFDHLTEHRQIINRQFDEVENDHDQFRQIILEQRNHSETHPLISRINQWEIESIEKIQLTANQCRRRFVNYTNNYIIQIENKLNYLAKQFKEIRQENEFNEIDLNQLKEKLNRLKEDLHTLPNLSIEQESTSFINKIIAIVPLGNDTKWKQVGISIAGGNNKGYGLNQLSCPFSISIDNDQTIYIVDCSNHRIVEWKSHATNGRIVAGGNESGKQTNQLNCPTDVIIDKENNSLIISDFGNRRIIRWSRQNPTDGEILISNIDCSRLTMDKNGSIYVSDSKKNEVRRWKKGEKDGTIVAGGNGQGNQLNQLNSPTFIVIDEDDSLYVSDQNNHRIIKWIKDAKEGIIVAGGNGQGKRLTQVSYPEGMIVDRLGQIYVADWDNDRVIRWCKGAKEGTIVVGNGKGQQSNQFNGPRGLSFDRQGNLYVVDSRNHRIQKFEID